MQAVNTNRTIVKWEVTKLVPHPRQPLLFPEPPRPEIEELAADIKRNGLLQPLEVLPDGTLVCGHKRAAAARLLGWAEIDAWVRHDLAAAGEHAVESRLIEDNLTRRQLGPLALARCYRRLKALARGAGERRLSGFEAGELRDQLGKRLGVSGRTLDRFLRILEHTPQEVQDAAEAGTLPLTLAEKVAGLPQQVRAQVAQKIRAGVPPRQAVGQFVARGASLHKHAHDALAAFVKELRRGVADLAGRVDEVHRISAEELKTLAEGETLLRVLKKRAQRQAKVKPSLGVSLGCAEDGEGLPAEHGAGDTPVLPADVNGGLHARGHCSLPAP